VLSLEPTSSVKQERNLPIENITVGLLMLDVPNFQVKERNIYLIILNYNIYLKNGEFLTQNSSQLQL
jgi:hypothetical protein